MNALNFINCPHCKYQYTPGEIFNPKHFLGQPKGIIRNNIGEILGYEGIPMDLNESYICENCNEEFKITAKLSFTTYSDKDSDNQEPQVRKITLF